MDSSGSMDSPASMDFQLQPVTEPGRRFVELCEKHASDFATRAEQHDREGSFPSENFVALRESGAIAAPIPEQFGGMGLTSLHDLAVGVNRLGRADGSTAIAFNMHLVACWQFRRAWEGDVADGEARAAAIEGFLAWLGTGEPVLCAGATEAGVSVGFPMTSATPTDGGWLLNGRKIFGTNSPIASIFSVFARLPADDGTFESVFAFVTRDAPGFEIKDNWDAMGMRASGSNDLVLTDCFVPEGMLLPIGPWGVLSAFWLAFYVAGNMGLLGAFLGIAEAARDAVVNLVTSRRKAPSNSLLAERYPIQHTVAEIEIDLAAARAMLERTARRADEYFDAHLPSRMTDDEMHQLNKDYICTKTFLNRKAIDIVDRAMAASGGAGYFSANPISRFYRDVRAGPFMQAYSPNEAYEYIGKVALGLPPQVDV